MSLVFGNKKYNGITLTGDRALETYAENTPPPEDVQRGRIYFANGNKHIGTGKAFAVAGYGNRKVASVLDENNIKRYGFSIFVQPAPNIIFITPTKTGDIVLQTKITVNLDDETVEEIGTNYTSQSAVCAFYKDNRLTVYIENIEDISSKINYFYGKDNHL